MTAKQPRRQKTPRERAEETLAVTVRKHDRLVKEVTIRRANLAAGESDLAEAKRRLDYAKQDPALPKTPSTTSNQSGDTTE